MAITAIKSGRCTPTAPSIRSFLFALSLILLSVAQANSAQDPPPNVFVDGQPIVAEEMNENFESLHERLLELEALLLGTPPATSPCTTNCTPSTTSTGPTGTTAAFAFVKEGVLFGANSAGVTSGQVTHKLVDANGVNLELISSGSLLAQDRQFYVSDFDIGPEIYNSTGVTGGGSLDLRFSVSSSGEPVFETEQIVGPEKSAELISSPTLGSSWWFETTDCTGQPYFRSTALGENIFQYQGQIQRLTFEGETGYRSQLQAKSKYQFDEAQNVVQCVEVDFLTGPVGILVPYNNGEVIRALIQSPIEVKAI